jgi:hypothetical protein
LTWKESKEEEEEAFDQLTSYICSAKTTKEGEEDL